MSDTTGYDDSDAGAQASVPPAPPTEVIAPAPRHARHAAAQTNEAAPQATETVPLARHAAPAASPAGAQEAAQETQAWTPAPTAPAGETQPIAAGEAPHPRHAASSPINKPVSFSERPSVLPTSASAQMMMGAVPSTADQAAGTRRTGEETQVLDPVMMQRMADADGAPDVAATVAGGVMPTPVIKPTPRPARSVASSDTPQPAASQPAARPAPQPVRQTPPPARPPANDDDDDDDRSGGVSGGTLALIIILVAVVCLGLGFGASYLMNSRQDAEPTPTATTADPAAALATCQDSVNRYNDSRNRWNTVVGEASAASQITADQVNDASTVENLSKALSAEVPELTQCDSTMTAEQLQQTTELNNTASDTLQSNADTLAAAATSVTDAAAAKTKADQDAQDAQDAADLEAAKSQLRDRIAEAKEELEAATKALGADDERVEDYAVAISTAQSVLDAEDSEAAQITSQASALNAQTEAMKAIVVAGSTQITPTATPSEAGEDEESTVVAE